MDILLYVFSFTNKFEQMTDNEMYISIAIAVILAGAVPAALLAILADLFLALVEHRLRAQ